MEGGVVNHYFDRSGYPLELLEWAKLVENKEYKIVLQETLPNGKWVSTVWLGLDHQFGKGPPLIFETMVFPKEGDYRDSDCERYSTEEEALKGHEAMVEKWSKQAN